MTDLIDPAILFANTALHDGWCCDCCAGYCPESEISDDSPIYADVMLRFESDGVEYVGSRHCVVRRDMIGDLPSKVAERLIEPNSQPTWTNVPASKPALSEKWHSPDMTHRLAHAGLTTHRGEDVQHLYLGDQHVGWVKHATNGCDPADLPLVRQIAEDIGVSLDRAFTALVLARGGAA